MATSLVKFGQPAAGQSWGEGFDPNQESLSDGIGAGFGVVHYRGKNWTLRYKGQSFMFTRPDDGTPAAQIHVIIVGQARHKSRSFYPKYEEDSNEAPTCASFDGIKPDAGVSAQQAQACAICPQNVLFVNPQTGKKTTACKEHKRLAVFLLPADSKRLLGEALLEPVFLRVPADSLQNLSLMGAEAQGLGYHYSTFVTKISFDPEKAYPKLVFEAVQPLPIAQKDFIKGLREDPLVDRIITGGGFTSRAAIAGPAQPTQGSLTAGLTQPATQSAPQPQMLELQATTVQPALQPAQQAQQQKPAPVAQTAAQVASPSTLDLTGFGGSGGPASGPTPPVSTAAAAPQAQDNPAVQGAPTEADDALDARINALMPS